MSESSDSTAVRTAGLVLSAIGAVAWLATFGWNSMGDYPDEATLVSLSGTVQLAEVRDVSTRTSLKRWDVIEVVSTGESADAKERWVFPENAAVFDSAVTQLEAGDKVTVRAKPTPELLRWSEEPVRIVWSLSKDGNEVVSYEQIVEVLDAARYQSPVAGLMVIAVGIAIVLASRIRFHKVPEPSQ